MRRISAVILLMTSTGCVSCDIDLGGSPGTPCVDDDECFYFLGGPELECFSGTCREIPGQCLSDYDCSPSHYACREVTCERFGLGYGQCKELDLADGGVCFPDIGVYPDSGVTDAGNVDSGQTDVPTRDGGPVDQGTSDAGVDADVISPD